MFSELRSFVLIGFGGRLSELAHISVRLAHISVRTRPRSRLVRNRPVGAEKRLFPDTTRISDDDGCPRSQGVHYGSGSRE